MKHASISKLSALVITSVMVAFSSCGAQSKSKAEIKSFKGSIIVGYDSTTKRVYQEVFGTLQDMQRAGVGNVYANQEGGLTLESQEGFNIECNSTYQGQYCILQAKPSDGPTCGSCGDKTGYFLHTAPVNWGFNMFLAARLDRNPNTVREANSQIVVTSLIDGNLQNDVLICARSHVSGFRSCGFSQFPKAEEMGKAVTASAIRGN